MLILTPLKYLAWYYLPGVATGQLLSLFYKAYSRILGRPPPAPGTPTYVFHHRMTYLLFSIVYLLCNLYDASVTMDPNYYELLGLPPTADEGMLKTAFRQFARRYHPDRVGAQGEQMFIEVRDAYDSLKSPVKRFAYERFGPEALSWSQCTTLREYVHHGLLQASGFYIVSLCSLIFFSFLNPSSPVSYWRYLMLAFTAVYELLFLLNPSPGIASDTTRSSVLFTDPAVTTHASLFSYLWPNRVAYQHVRFLHKLWLLGCFTLSNVVPVVFPTPSAESHEKWILNEAQRIAGLSTSIARESTPASEGTFPYLGDLPTGPGAKPADEVVALLATELEHLIVETQMRADGGPLRSAVENAIERRKRDAARVGRSAGREGAGGAQGRPWVQPNGSVGGVKERVLGYVRGRSRSLG
ncbi:hypothetical protein BD414DRAFT_516950 [Trametes punicea]|nr:hypothetical protein BD414DRAFT_516950 [Trametes punicea]